MSNKNRSDNSDSMGYYLRDFAFPKAAKIPSKMYGQDDRRPYIIGDSVIHERTRSVVITAEGECHYIKEDIPTSWYEGCNTKPSPPTIPVSPSVSSVELSGPKEFNAKASPPRMLVSPWASTDEISGPKGSFVKASPPTIPVSSSVSIVKIVRTWNTQQSEFVDDSVMQRSTSLLKHINVVPNRLKTYFSELTKVASVVVLLILITWFFGTIFTVDGLTAFFENVVEIFLYIFKKKEPPCRCEHLENFLKFFCPR